MIRTCGTACRSVLTVSGKAVRDIQRQWPEKKVRQGLRKIVKQAPEISETC
jgi:hypothetical protein